MYKSTTNDLNRTREHHVNRPYKEKVPEGSKNLRPKLWGKREWMLIESHSRPGHSN